MHNKIISLHVYFLHLKRFPRETKSLDKAGHQEKSLSNMARIKLVACCSAWQIYIFGNLKTLSELWVLVIFCQRSCPHQGHRPVRSTAMMCLTSYWRCIWLIFFNTDRFYFLTDILMTLKQSNPGLCPGMGFKFLQVLKKAEQKKNAVKLDTYDSSVNNKNKPEQVYTVRVTFNSFIVALNHARNVPQVFTFILYDKITLGSYCET